MARIIFLAPFEKSEISGGIKMAYRHAELLNELGYDAYVYQPDGQPVWFDASAKLLQKFAPVTGDTLVFPETLNGPLAEMAQAPSPARKVMFCQNQYYMAMNVIPAERLTALGFSAFAASSLAARDFLQNVLRLPNPAVIPCFVDPDIFFPRAKTLQIALIPRKMPREAGLIRAIFQAKYPHLCAVPWQAIDNASERQTADILGRSAIFLSLSFFESFGLVPVEAMASGCIVAGFDGYGGREYAAPENGFWFAPDCVEEVTDALAAIVAKFERDDPALQAIRDAGAVTAARYTKDNTRDALKRFYGGLT